MAETGIEYTGTKLALIEAAGALFAEHGYEGTSIRSIAERVGANLAAIHYHFGSKENLYTEVLRYVLMQVKTSPAKYLKIPEHFTTPEKKAAILAQVIRDRIDAYMSSEQPRWYGRVFIRALQDPSSPLQTVLEEKMRPDQTALKTIIQRCCPELSDADAELWAFSITGQVALYVFSEVPILMLMGKERYEPEFLDRVASHVTRFTLKALGLPVPENRP